MPRILRGLLIGALALLGTTAAAPSGGGLTAVGDTAASSVAGARLDPVLGERLAAGDTDGSMVVFVHATDISSARAAVAAAGLRLIDSFDRVGVAVALGPLAAVADVSHRPGVSYVEAGDTPIVFATETAHVATRGRDVLDGFDVAAGTQHVGPYDGSGVSIAVVDSGIDAGHPFFQTAMGSKVVRNVIVGCLDEDLLEGELGIDVPASCPSAYGIGEDPVVDADASDLLGHGTHVAGIAAGAEVTDAAGRRLHGAAPGASLVGVAAGPGVLWSAAVGLNWVLENHAAPCGTPSASCPPIRVVNNSWSEPGGGEYEPDDVRNKLASALIADGVTVVWSAGNNHGDGSVTKTSQAGANPLPGNIMVAAYDDHDGGRRDLGLAWFSSRGQRGAPETYPDVSAPGLHITSACARGSFNWTSTGELDYCALSGTSMAAPNVAGIVALLLQAEPALTPAEVEDILEDTAHPFGARVMWEPDPSNPGTVTAFDRGHGLVDAAAAVARALDLPAPPDPPETIVTAFPDGRVSDEQPSHAFTSEPMTNLSYDSYGCEGLAHPIAERVSTSGCHHEYVQVTVPRGGASLRVAIGIGGVEATLGAGSLADLDLLVLGPDGALLGSSLTLASADEEVVIPVTTSGIYTVRIVGYFVAEGTASGTVTLLAHGPDEAHGWGTATGSRARTEASQERSRASEIRRTGAVEAASRRARLGRLGTVRSTLMPKSP